MTKQFVTQAKKEQAVETENITVQIPNVFREYLFEETQQRDQNSFSRSPVHFQSAGQLEIMEANRFPESPETYGLSEMELDDLILFFRGQPRHARSG